MIDVDRIFARWGAMSSAPRTEADAAKLLGISMGLGALFNDSLEAECCWMNTYNDHLGGVPINQVLAGNIDRVLTAVEFERNIR